MRITTLALSSFVGLLTLGSAGCVSAPAPVEQTEHASRATLYTAVVAADQPLASQAGAKMLEQGGNAVDAAVAAAFTLSIVRPQSCGIGGGGFMVIHLPAGATRDGEAVTVAINGREWCPAGVRPETFEKSADPRASTIGGLAVAVPGTVAALLHAQEKYGRLDRRAVLQPAIDVARDGFIADAAYVSAVNQTLTDEGKAKVDLTSAFYREVLGAGERRIGDAVRNPGQAAALQKIASQGTSAFYSGEIADAIVNAVRRSGGVLTHEDLAEYARSGVIELQPVRAAAFGRTFITMPPPSSGGVALTQVLGMLDAVNTSPSTPEHEAAYLHALAECFKLAFADRAAFMADPAFTPVPTARLLSEQDIRDRARMIDPTRTYGPSRYVRASIPEPIAADHGTSHVSAVDRWGGACAATETVNLFFGSHVVAEPFGFVLNNQMDDFTTRRGKANAFGLKQSDVNLPQPRKRPLSSMTPTIVLDADGRLEAVAGASGGPRIITATVQSLINALLRGEDAQAAVSRPRVHHQWMPDTLYWELLADSAENDRLSESLTDKGHNVQAAKGESAVQLIVRARGALSVTYTAGCDPRKGGAPAGVTAGN